MSWQNILNSRQIETDIQIQENSFVERNQSYLHFLIKQGETMPRSYPRSATYGQERQWKGFFDFPEIVNNYGLKRGTVCQIVRFIFQFSLKLYIQIWKYFHSTILGSVGRGCCKKNRVLEFLVKIFVKIASAPLNHKNIYFLNLFRETDFTKSLSL